VFTQPACAFNPDDCRVNADTDILGLGVRLGIYFQLISNVYIAFIHPEEAAGSLPTNNMFMTAIFVSLLYSIVQNNLPSGAIVCALWIVLLDLPIIIPTIITAAVTSRSGIVLSYWTVSVTLLRLVAFNIFNTWFWFRGLDHENQTQCQEPRVFFFANLSALGGIRTYYKVNMVLNCLASLMVLGIWIFMFLSILQESNRQSRWVYRLKSDRDNALGVFAIGTGIVSVIFGLYGMVFYALVGVQVLQMQTGVPIARRIVCAILCGATLVALFIMPMELQVSWNKLEGVGGITSTGQLISLTVGTFSLIRAVFLMGIGDSERDSVQNGERDLESQGCQPPETEIVVHDIHTTETHERNDSTSAAQNPRIRFTSQEIGIGVRVRRRKTL
jgi:hypothetical protein